MKYLYHILSANSLIHNLKCNCIKGDNYSGVSLTRSKKLSGYLGERAGAFFKLELNYELLKKDYKLKDTVYVSSTGISFDEEKETWINKPITNLSKYLTKIILIKYKVENLKQNDWFSTIGVRAVPGFKTAPEIIKFIYKKYKNLFYIQEGNNIQKIDPKYILSLSNSIKTVFKGYTAYYRGYIEKKNSHFKIKTQQEICLPLDKYNKRIDQLVIGYDYKDLKLYKNKKYAKAKFLKSIDAPKIFTYDQYDIFIFHFTYIPKNIKNKNEKYDIVSEAHLTDLEKIQEKRENYLT